MKLLGHWARKFGMARGIALFLLIALVALRLVDPLPFQELRVRVFDLFQVLHPREALQRPVVIVDIDEKSLNSIGQWPWPRTRIADLITRLTEMGAVVIAFDIVFAEPDRTSPGIVADGFRDLDETTRAKLRALPSNDAVFAEALRRSRVVLGESGLPFAVAHANRTDQPRGVATIGGDPAQYLLSYPGLLRNVLTLEEAASGRGLFTIRTERDGIVRRVPIVMQAQGTIMPSLSLEMLRLASGSNAVLIRSDRGGIQSAAIPGFVIPTDRNGQLWVYFAPHDKARYVSAVDILEGQVPPDRVARRLVLIGTSAVGLLDSKTTPIDPVMPGVEIHAQVLENVLTGTVLSAPNYALAVELCAAVVLGLAIIWLAPTLNATLLLVFGAGLVALTVGASWLFYLQKQLLFDSTYPLLSSALVYLTLVFSNYISEQAQRRRIRSAFGQYLSPELVEQLAQSPEKLVLGGEEREMSILFSDVRGFTTISELYKDDPQGLTSLMNSFLTPLTNTIIDQKGTIDKYMGDAIMAFWNAPLHDTSHEINACEAALRMLRCVDTLNQQREQHAKETGQRFIPIQVGVGINTGKCVVGNMGSDLRFNYSVLGDAVNLASRLEGQSKTYGLPIIIGSKTASALGEKFAVLELDCITVKGKTEPESVYTVLGGADVAGSDRFGQLNGEVTDMLSRYRQRDFSGAAKSIVRCRKIDGGFGLETLFDLYEERIQAFEVDPPPPDWNGVAILETK